MRPNLLLTAGIFWIPALGMPGDINFSVHSTSDDIGKHVYLFAHGLGATQTQGLTLFGKIKEQTDGSVLYNPRWLLGTPCALFNFADAKNDNNEYERTKVNLGQEHDVQRLHEAYKKLQECFPEHNVILIGVSRGASTIINFVAQYQPKNIDAIVLESPFDTLSSVIKHLLSRYCIGWFPFAQHIGHKICQKHFPNVQIKGTFPLENISKIPHKIPIIFVHSKRDKVIPVKCSRALYLKLKQEGHPNTYLVELNSGSHGKLIHGEDSDFYLYCVHAFYKKHGLPHNHECATPGLSLLHHCQPSISEILERLERKRLQEELEEGPPLVFNEDAAHSLELTWYITKNLIQIK